jgi:hypothetical protein
VETKEVDSVSGASQIANTASSTDTRKEVALSISHTVGDWKIEPGYVFSEEGDYRSNTPALSLSKDFFQKNTTVKAGYSHGFDEDLHAPSSGKKDMDNYSLSLTQVLSPQTVAQIGYTFSHAKGYLAGGHRRVVLEDELIVREYVPDERKRDAFGIRVAQWLPTEGSIQLSYRYYRDTWQIGSNTYTVQINQYITDLLLVRGEYRHYNQSAPYFVKDSYTGTEKYLTQAASLMAFDSNLYGIKFLYTIKKIWDWDIEAKYERYSQSNDTNVDIYMAGLRVLF